MRMTPRTAKAGSTFVAWDGVRHEKVGARRDAPGRMGLRSEKVMVWQTWWRWHWLSWTGRLLRMA